ncbi:MAG: hypothetical protein R2697_10820 [Ilumatobacteraceae bacterium]
MSEVVEGVSTAAAGDERNEPGSSRRQLFGKGAAVLAVAAVAGVGSSSKVSAGNGSAMVIGFSNSGTNTTTLTGGSTFKVTNGTSDSDGNISVYGVNNATSGIGVSGDSGASTGVGVYGHADGSSGVGVYGEFTGGPTYAGTGIIGESNLGTGVIGRGTSYDVYAGQSGKLGLGSASVSAGAAGSVGTIARDSSGVLWYCYAGNKWQRLGGAAVAGAFTAIAPARVFDSRLATYAPSNGPLSALTTRTISVKDGRDPDGNVIAANVVPAGATAVMFNVTVAQTTAPSHLSVVPGDVTETSSSTINWTGPNVVAANGSLSKLDANRQLNLIAGPNGTVHCIVDITGYFL